MLPKLCSVHKRLEQIGQSLFLMQHWLLLANDSDGPVSASSESRPLQTYVRLDQLAQALAGSTTNDINYLSALLPREVILVTVQIPDLFFTMT